MAEEPQLPTEEDLREALDRVRVSDILVNALSAAASIGFHRVSAGARDLAQVRIAIESLRALEPVLREGGVDEAVVRDLEQARTNLQLSYAKAVAEPASEADTEATAAQAEAESGEGDEQQGAGHV